jgi:hypothetical protein
VFTESKRFSLLQVLILRMNMKSCLTLIYLRWYDNAFHEKFILMIRFEVWESDKHGNFTYIKQSINALL